MTSHRGRRSFKAKLSREKRRQEYEEEKDLYENFREAVYSYVYAVNVRDYVMAETICRRSKEEVLQFLSNNGFTNNMYQHWVPDVERGVVFNDSRGRGFRMFAPKITVTVGKGAFQK